MMVAMTIVIASIAALGAAALAAPMPLPGAGIGPVPQPPSQVPDLSGLSGRPSSAGPEFDCSAVPCDPATGLPIVIITGLIDCGAKSNCGGFPACVVSLSCPALDGESSGSGTCDGVCEIEPKCIEAYADDCKDKEKKEKSNEKPEREPTDIGGDLKEKDPKKPSTGAPGKDSSSSKGDTKTERQKQLDRYYQDRIDHCMERARFDKYFCTGVVAFLTKSKAGGVVGAAVCSEWSEYVKSNCAKWMGPRE